MPDVPVALSPNPRADAPERPRLSPEQARAAIRAAEVALLDERRQLTADELVALADVPDSSVPALAALAHEVRLAWCGDTVEVEGILSAKTGGCPEDCHFCSQSASFESPGAGHAVPRHRRGHRRRQGDRRPRRHRVLHRARHPRPRRAHDEAHPRARADRARGGRHQRRRQRRHHHRRPGPPPRRGWRPPLQPQPRDRRVVLPERRHHPLVGRALRDLPAGAPSTAWSCAAACCSAWARPTTQRLELRRPAAGGRPGRGADQLPQPPPGHAVRRPPAGRAARGHPLDRPVPPRASRR